MGGSFVVGMWSLAGVVAGAGIAGIGRRADQAEGAGSRGSIPGPPGRPQSPGSGRRAPSVGCSRPSLRSVEGHTPIAQRDVCVMADDEVVEQLDVEQAAGRQRLGGEVQVVG